MRRMWWGALGGIAVAASFWACSDSNDVSDPGDARNQGRSELRLEILSADVPESGEATVRFRALDAAGNPIDLAREIQNAGAQPALAPRTRPRFTLAQADAEGNHVSYFERTVSSAAFEGGTPALPSATQAVSDPGGGAFPADRLQSQGDGEWLWRFAPPTRAGLDRTRTHLVAMWATRTIADAQGVERSFPASASLAFVPAGGTPDRDEVVADAACNTCHGVLQAHDQRRGVQLCITCHSPQSTDPETGNTVDFKVMVHKIHRGAQLPSVRAGGSYRVIGFQQSIHDYSRVGFPRSILDCASCHQGEDAARWYTAPSAAACTSCHDNVRFEGGAAVCSASGPDLVAECRHLGGVPATARCADCHTPEQIQGSHVDPVAQQLGRFRYEIVSVTVAADRRPVVRFRVTDPSSGGAPWDIKAAPEWTTFAGGASRLFVDLGWPAAELTNAGSEQNYGQPVQIDALQTATPVEGQAGTWQVISPVAIPAEVTGSGVAVLEGHPAVGGLRIPVTNDLRYFGIGGGAGTPRRTVVTSEKCNACHGQLTAHGNNRSGRVEVCAVCHNPDATDKGRRPSGVPGEHPVDLKTLIHEVHGSDVRTNDVTVYGFGGTAHVFPLGFSGSTGACQLCHEGETWRIPLGDPVLGTTFSTGADPRDPGDNARTPRNQAVCLSCHDSQTAVDHARAFTQPGGVEQCAICHAPNTVADVARVHSIVPR
jgi:OmcA/MtrC family decaheme c-type cytochrome